MRAAVSRTTLSSSTSSIVSLPDGSAGVPSSACSTGASTIGSSTVNVLPAPGALSTSTPPPPRVAAPSTEARPMPVPRPNGLVVKNGSKIRPRAAASMPAPVSRTASAAYAPGTSGAPPRPRAEGRPPRAPPVARRP